VIALSGYDARKKIKGKRRHVLVDTQGLLMHALVHAGDVQDRDGRATRDGEPFRRLCVSASSSTPTGYQGTEFQAAAKKVLAIVNVDMVKRSDQAKDFLVLPKRWIVERTLLARPLPKARQGLGVLQPEGIRLSPPRLHSLHAARAARPT
jgi:transposase